MEEIKAVKTKAIAGIAYPAWKKEKKSRMEEFKHLHLNKYRPKRQDATQAHDDRRFHEPDNQTEGGGIINNNNVPKYQI